MSGPFFHYDPQPLDDGAWRTGCHYTEQADDGSEQTWVIQVEWQMFTGRHDPRRVDIRSEDHNHAVRADAIRRLPLASIFTEMQRHAEESLSRLAERPPLSTGYWGEPPDTDEARAVSGAYRGEAVKFGAQRGRRLSPSLLEQVALIYRQAYAARRPVTAAVAEGTGCKPSTASKRIMAARKAGLLDDIPPEEARR